MHFNIHTIFCSCLSLARRGKSLNETSRSTTDGADGDFSHCFQCARIFNLQSFLWAIWRTTRNEAAPTFPNFVCSPPRVSNPEIIIEHWRNSISNFYHWYYHLIVRVTMFLLFAVLWFANRNAIRYCRWKQIIAFQSIRNGWRLELRTSGSMTAQN